MALAVFLERRLAELERERVETLQSVEGLREKIEAAEAKRASQVATEYYEKWSDILESLASQLDKAKGRLSSVESEMGDKAHKLDELGGSANETAAEDIRDGTGGTQLESEPGEDETARAQQTAFSESEEPLGLEEELIVLDEPIETPEAGGQRDEEEPAPEAADSELEPGLEPVEELILVDDPTEEPGVEPRAEEADLALETAEPELAAEPEPVDELLVEVDASSAPTAAPEPPQPAAAGPDDLYQSALQKISSDATGTLTLAEFEALVGFYERLVAGAGSGTPPERVRTAVLKAVLRASSEYERIRAKAAACVRANLDSAGGGNPAPTAPSDPPP